MHQVRLAEADAAVDEQRVVGAPGILRDLQRGGACASWLLLPSTKVREREVRIEAAADASEGRVLGAACRARSCRQRLRRSAAGRARADLEHDRRGQAADTDARRRAREIRLTTFSFTQSTTNRFGASSRKVLPSSTACERSDPRVLNCRPPAVPPRVELRQRRHNEPCTVSSPIGFRPKNCSCECYAEGGRVYTDDAEGYPQPARAIFLTALQARSSRLTLQGRCVPLPPFFRA